MADLLKRSDEPPGFGDCLGLRAPRREHRAPNLRCGHDARRGRQPCVASPVEVRIRRGRGFCGAARLVAGSSAETIRALNGAWDALTTVSGLFMGVFVVAASLLAFETRTLARWLRWLGLVGGAVLIIGAGSVGTPFHGVGPFWVVGVAATMVWIAATGVWLLVRRPVGGTRG